MRVIEEQAVIKLPNDFFCKLKKSKRNCTYKNFATKYNFAVLR